MFKTTLTTAVLLASFCGSAFAQENDGDIDFDDGILTIIGSNGSDTCNVRIDGNKLEVLLETPDDTKDRDVKLWKVNLIIFMGFDGNDTFRNDSDVPCDAYGGAGIDTLYGGTGRDMLDGGDDGDFLYGGDDNDRLYGGAGPDFLAGEDGNDSLKPGLGEDEFGVVGGAGFDLLWKPVLIDSWTRELVYVDVNFGQFSSIERFSNFRAGYTPLTQFGGGIGW